MSDTSHLKRNAISVRLVENKRTDKLHLSQRIRYTRSPPVRSLWAIIKISQQILLIKGFLKIFNSLVLHCLYGQHTIRFISIM